MAMRPLPDGSIEVTDDTGVRPPVILPPQAAASLGPTAPLPPLTIDSLPPAPAAAAALPPLPPTLASGPTALAQNAPPAPAVPLLEIQPDVTAGRDAAVAATQTPDEKLAAAIEGAYADPLGFGARALTGGEVDLTAKAPAAPQPPPEFVGGQPPQPQPLPGTEPNGQVSVDDALAMGGAWGTAEFSRGKPGGYSPPQPAFDLLKQFEVEKGRPPLPDELKALMGATYAEGQDVAIDTGAAVSHAQAKAARDHAANADLLRRETAAIMDRQRQDQEAVQQRLSVVDAHIDRIQRDSTRDVVKEYWASDEAPSRLQVAMGAFGAALLGSTVNPVLAQANAEVNAAVQQQKMKLDAGAVTTQDMLGAVAQMRATFTSPEAADAGAKALLFASLEQQANSLAASTASPEAQGKYLQLANQFAQQYAGFLVDAHTAESDKTTQKFVHVPAKAGGYTKGRPVEFSEMVARYKKAGFDDKAAIAHAGAYAKAVSDAQSRGLSPDAARAEAIGKLRAVSSHFLNEKPKMDRAEAALEIERMNSQVVYPDGTIMYVSPTQSKDAQNKATAYYTTKQTLARIKDLAEKGWTWKDLPTGERRAIETNVQFMQYALKKGWLDEALTVGERPFMDKMTGEALLSRWELGSEAEANLREIDKNINIADDALKRTMFLDPAKRQPYAATQQAPKGAVKEF